LAKLTTEKGGGVFDRINKIYRIGNRLEKNLPSIILLILLILSKKDQ
jgi:hypothetical protein